MIFEGSRYQTATILALADNNGVYHSTVLPRVNPPAVTDYTMHRVAYGDRLDLLASRAYGDPELWWRIADANPDLTFPDQLQVGALIKVPRVAVG